jgi:hypothetical protein
VTGTPGRVAEIRLYDQISAITHPRRFGSNAVLWTSVRGLGCDGFRRLIAEVLLAPDERVALAAAGWRVTRVDRFATDGVPVHQVWAVDGRRRIVYVRRGHGLRADRSVYRAGQTILLPRTGSGCTAAFVLRVPLTGTLLGLSAGHCSRYPFFSASGVYETEDAVLLARSGGRRRKLGLGPVSRNTVLQQGGLDAMVYALHGVRYAAQEIQRGSRAPLRVTGWLPNVEQWSGRLGSRKLVCYYGRISGEHCGRIAGRVPLLTEDVVCARLKRDVIPGDSGGPVYTKPERGKARAVGVVLGSFDLLPARSTTPSSATRRSSRS